MKITYGGGSKRERTAREPIETIIGQSPNPLAILNGRNMGCEGSENEFILKRTLPILRVLGLARQATVRFQ